MIVCSKCKTDDSDEYYITSCHDFTLCKDCATPFLKNDFVNCPKCHQRVQFFQCRHENSISKNEIYCNSHKRKCEFFCQDCHQFLCGDCIFEQLHESDNKHKDHKILKNEELFENANQQIQSSLSILKSLYNNVDLDIKKYNSIKTTIESKYDETLILMHHSFESIKNHILKTKKEYEDKIMESVSKNEEAVTKILEIANISEEILNSHDLQISAAAFSLYNKIHEISESDDLKQSLVTLPKNIFTNELIPSFSGFTIVIPKFTESIAKNKFKTTYSPSVEMYHGKWRTKILLLEKDGSSYLSIFLEYLSGVDGPLVIEYKVQINHPTKNDVLSKTFKSEFNIMDSWGWNKFALINDIQSGGFVREDDSLSLEIKLRPASYAEYSKIFEKLLSKYKIKYKELKQKKKETESKSKNKSKPHHKDDE